MKPSQPGSPSSKPRKKRGAPKGNTNALKHGYYAKVFPASRGGNLEQFDFANLEEEIMLVRLALRQVAAFNSEVKTFQEASSLLRLVCLGVGTLNRLLRTRALVKTDPSRFKNYFEFSRWWQTVLDEEHSLDEEAAGLEGEAEPFPEEDPNPAATAPNPDPIPHPTPGPEAQLFSEEDEDDIPPALDPDGHPIDFEANLNDPNITPAWHIPGAVIPTTPGRAKKIKPTQSSTPERSARWYAPPGARGKELNRIDISPKTNAPARHRHRSHRRDRAESAAFS